MKSDNSFATIVQFASRLSIGSVIKFAFMLLSFFYIFFAFALWRQVQLMSSVVEIGDTSILKIISVVHLLAAILVFILAVILI